MAFTVRNPETCQLFTTELGEPPRPPGPARSPSCPCKTPVEVKELGTGEKLGCPTPPRHAGNLGRGWRAGWAQGMGGLGAGGGQLSTGREGLSPAALLCASEQSSLSPWASVSSSIKWRWRERQSGSGLDTTVVCRMLEHRLYRQIHHATVLSTQSVEDEQGDYREGELAPQWASHCPQN